MSDKTIAVPRDQLMKLIELAEEDLYVQEDEFSNSPTDADRELMLSLYRLVGKDVPQFLTDIFGWQQETDHGTT